MTKGKYKGKGKGNPSPGGPYSPPADVMKSGVGRNSGGSSPPGPSAPAPCSTNHSRNSNSDTALTASPSSADTRFPTSVEERKFSTVFRGSVLVEIYFGVSPNLDRTLRKRCVPVGFLLGFYTFYFGFISCIFTVWRRRLLVGLSGTAISTSGLPSLCISTVRSWLLPFGVLSGCCTSTSRDVLNLRLLWYMMWWWSHRGSCRPTSTISHSGRPAFFPTRANK